MINLQRLKTSLLTSIFLLAVSVVGSEVFARNQIGTNPDGDAADIISEQLLSVAAPGYLAEDINAQLINSDIATSFAVTIDPKNARAWKIRADVLATRGDYSGAAEALKKYLQLSKWVDYAAAVDWLRYSLGALGKSELRIDLLKSVVDDTGSGQNDIPLSVKAEALANWAAILEGRGRFDLAADKYRQALELDANHADAAQSVLRLSDTVTMAQRADTSVRLLNSNPKAVNIAWELGMICRDIGLFNRAIGLYDFALKVTDANKAYEGRLFRSDHAETLLDAGQYQQLVDLYDFDPDSASIDLAIAGSLAEAYRRLDMDQRAAAIIARMDKEYKSRQSQGRKQATVAADIAWFNFLFTGQSQVAGDWADIAINIEPDDSIIRRTWAMTHINNEDSQDRVNRILDDLAGQDLYCLTVKIVRNKISGEDYSDLLKSVSGFMRRGHPWRFAMDMFRQNGIALPGSHEDAIKVSALVDGYLASQFAAMAVSPEKFIAMELGLSEKLSSGRSVILDIKLRNISTADVPVGKWGLLTPIVLLHVKMTVPQQQYELSQNVAVAMPCSRYLKAGDEVKTAARIDIGQLGRELFKRPVSEIEFEVEAVLDPVNFAGEIVSSLPAVTVKPVKFKRPGIASPLNDDTYFESLSDIADDLQSDSPAVVAMATVKTASLLAMAQEVKGGNALCAEKVAGRIREPQTLAMMKYALNHSDWQVRFIALEMLCRIKTDDFILKLAAPLLDDANSLVRAKAVELFSQIEQVRSLGLLERFASGDADPYVRNIAELLGRK